ncbi:MAG: 30S ribosomal protein S6 [Rubinisphaera brasiliensis]|nr:MULTISPECIES: 30S ribosomal protein S6 [Rubinisphaera]MBR9803096.1 30S ribosomal protein S6 [bacterium]
MAIRSYEIMFLLDSGKYATDPDGVTAEVNGILEKIEAEVVAARPWMDGKLAYEIDGHRKGLHYLCYVKADSLKVQQLQRICRLSDVVLRHLCILPPEQLFDVMAQSLLDPNAVLQNGEEGGEEASAEESKDDKKEEKKEETVASN